MLDWEDRALVQVHSIHVGLSQMDPFVSFLIEGALPKEKAKAKKVQRRPPQYWLSKQQKLYRQSYAGPYLLCVHPEAVEVLLEELHEGICGGHTGGRSLAHRALTQGYQWLSMQKFAQDYVRKCDQCQRYALNIHQPGGTLNPLSNPWPFEPFPRATGSRKWLFVRTNYFTKWVKTEPLTNIWDQDIKKFVLRNIITRFEVPYTLISNNGLQFDSKAFKRYYGELGIRNRFSTSTCLQSNGQAESYQ